MGNLNLNDEIRVKGDVRTDKGSQPLMRKIPPFGFRGWLATILIMAAGGTKNRLMPGLRGFGVPALAGGAVARSRALRPFEVILFASAPPPEGGTPNLRHLLKLGLRFAGACERRWTAAHRVQSPGFMRSAAKMRIALPSRFSFSNV